MSKPLSAIGFLTALEDPQSGFFGGYLILSSLGRPLEFHCSTPVMPNRAQRILYGKSLSNYIYSDLIGQTLLGKGLLPVQAILTDRPEMLHITLLRDETIICVESNDSMDQSLDAVSAPHFNLGTYRLFGSAMCVWHPDVQREILQPLSSHVDLLEPFERIREAIREAQGVNTEPADHAHNVSDAA